MAEEQKKETTNNNASIIVELIPCGPGVRVKIRVCDGPNPVLNQTARDMYSIFRSIAISQGAEVVK